MLAEGPLHFQRSCGDTIGVMGFFETASLLITLAAFFSFVNCKYIRLPATIGVMFMALATSGVILALGSVAKPIRDEAARIVGGIDFHQALLNGMLAFLLFAGSLNLEFEELSKEWDSIAVLAMFGTAVSTFLVGVLCWLVFNAMGLYLPLVYCFVFGALISPTDPIAILAIMRKVGAPRNLETVMAGESLFNDGIGVVLFLAIAALAPGMHGLIPSDILLMLVRQGFGGVAVGLGAGLFTYQLLKRVDNYQVEVLLTLALAMGGYSLAAALHVSAPIAIVVAGLFIGNRGRKFGMSEETRRRIDTFWELIDEVMNAVLFLLIGLELLVVQFHYRFFPAGIIAIVIVLLCRWLSVATSVTLMRAHRMPERGRIAVLTWGGLRGGLSVAMALSLPKGDYRNLILAITYAVVVFCIFVQGLSASAVIRWAVGRRTNPMSNPAPAFSASNSDRE